jgi:hypothetical protein
MEDSPQSTAVAGPSAVLASVESGLHERAKLTGVKWLSEDLTISQASSHILKAIRSVSVQKQDRHFLVCLPDLPHHFDPVEAWHGTRRDDKIGSFRCKCVIPLSPVLGLHDKTAKRKDGGDTESAKSIVVVYDEDFL